MKAIHSLVMLSILVAALIGHTNSAAAIHFDHLVLLAPHEHGEYSGYKRRGNEIVLEKGQRHLLVYPVEQLEDGSIHGLLAGNLSIRGLQPDLDRILLLEMKGDALPSVQEMIDNGPNGDDAVRWAPSGRSNNIIYLAESPDGISRFVYFHLAPGASAAMGYAVDNWSTYTSTDPDLLGAISSEESQRIQIWASELVEGSQPWAIPPSIGVDEIFESERTLIARERIMAAEPDADDGDIETTEDEFEDDSEDEFDHLVLLAPHEHGEYSGYKRRGNEIVLEKGQRHLLVYPVEQLEDGSIHGLLAGNLSIRGLQPDLDRILLLEMKGDALPSVQEMIDNGPNGDDAVRWAPSGRSNNIIYLAESPDGISRFVYFHLAPGASAAMGYAVDNWSTYTSTDPDLLGAISSEESQRIQIWASELVEGSQPWAIPPSIGVDEIFESERTLISR